MLARLPYTSLVPRPPPQLLSLAVRKALRDFCVKKNCGVEPGNETSGVEPGNEASGVEPGNEASGVEPGNEASAIL